MATSMTSRGRVNLGAGFVKEFGDWSATDTTAMNFSVSGGYVASIDFYDANQNPCSNAGTGSTVTLSAKSTSGSVTTYTMTPGGTAVSGGTYCILHGGV